MSESTHKAEVVEVNFERHPNADSLSVTTVFGGYTYVGKTDAWVGVKRAAFIPPDTTVDVRRHEFAFLADQAKADGRARIKAKKLRGVVSYGLMVPVPDDTPLGEDWFDRLGLEHYEPPLEHEKGGGQKFFTGGEVASGPNVVAVKYDVDAFLRYHKLFADGEPVVVTEKLDGANARYVFSDGKMHCGSRTEWKKEFPTYDHLSVDILVGKGMDRTLAEQQMARLHAGTKKKNLWWAALETTPALEKFCRDNPDTVVYGEVYGNVNCIKYGLPDGNRFAAFDLLKDGRWVDFERARFLLLTARVPMVPVLNKESWQETFPVPLVDIPYDFATVKALAEGPTLVAGAKEGTMREGVVIKPLVERWDPHVGRVAFKCVSAAFLEKYR